MLIGVFIFRCKTMPSLIYSDDSVFSLEKTQTVVNTINCVGVMGAGIALEYKLRYPKMYEDYVINCRKHEVKIGIPYLYKNDDKWILNFPTKKHWKDDSKLEWIESGLKYFSENYKHWGITSIAFPKLGTAHGGLIWEDVQKIMESYLENLDIPVFICLDKLEYPKGIEKYMTDYFNQLDEDYFVKIGVAKPIIPKIINNQPLKKFRSLIELEGVGRISYEKIYLYLFDQITNKNQFFPEIKNKKLDEISIAPNYIENISTNLNFPTNGAITVNNELLNKFKMDLNTLLDLRDRVKNIEKDLKSCSLELVKNYLLQVHPEINWNKYKIKGQDIECKSNNKNLVIGKVIFDINLKKNDFDQNQKRVIKNALKKIETSTHSHKYLFVIDEHVFNLLQTKYNRDYPHVEFINILNPQLKSGQQKLVKSENIDS